VSAGGGLQDRFGRTLRTLRVSVTDRCDMRCTYCMPATGMAWLPKQDLLGFEELERVVRAFVELGVSRLRLTGGEPLLRQDLPMLVRAFAALPGVEDLALTTNGSRLAGLAPALKAAGLQRATVSLDSLDPARFAAITRGGDLAKVWEGLLAAEAAGLRPLKLNAVLTPLNEPDLLDLAALTLRRDWDVRFIEVMPISAAVGAPAAGLPMAALKRRLEERWGRLQPLEAGASAPARRWRIPGARGAVGFIASVSDSFCGSCDRLRLSATGRLQLCLAHPDGLDLRSLLRGGASDAALKGAISEAVWRKPAGHEFQRQAPAPQAAMSRIGG
jgi:cyclic pyranopterin phosphate synthase